MRELGVSQMQKFWSLAVFAGLVVIAASSGATFMPGPWYAGLSKPSWTPPNWVFPVAWTILYAMIAIAGWLAWRAGGWNRAVLIWGAGLVLNTLWSYLMFGRHDIFLALIDLAALWIATAVFIWAVWPVDVRAAYLFMPYLAWVSFAGALNFAVWRMN
jgi:tryptophan-rich sensory protein